MELGIQPSMLRAWRGRPSLAAGSASAPARAGVSPDLISAVTDAILDEIAEWQSRPLEALYPLVFFDALRVKIRDEGTVRNTAVYIALGVRADGRKEILGLWIEQSKRPARAAAVGA